MALNNCSNGLKGMGLGKIFWETILQNEFANGTELVKTRISVENLKFLIPSAMLGAEFLNCKVFQHSHI